MNDGLTMPGRCESLTNHFRSKIEYERYDVLAVETKPEDHPDISYYIESPRRRPEPGSGEPR